MAAGTSGSTGISYATPGNTTLTYCTLTGTVPVGWTVSLYGGTDLYLANRSVNDGTIAIGSEFDTFNQTVYSGNLIGLGRFTNNGKVVLQADPSNPGIGYNVEIEAPLFVNDGPLWRRRAPTANELNVVRFR